VTAPRIPFNRPFLTGQEIPFIQQACASGILAGDAQFTGQCERWIEQRVGCRKALLTHSCTAALEMSAILAEIQQGDEVIMPSFTFVTTATAFVLRGARPVFVDIRKDTLNIDETKIEAAITSRTRAIVVVHYAGVGCEMDAIMGLARQHGLNVIEDAAQGIMASYKMKPLGSFGKFGALSFHETKNLIAGQGGALLINDEQAIERAEIVWQKGTNRSKFSRGQVDKYTWTDIGSSFLSGELTAAFLWGQLSGAGEIMRRRLALWNRYHDGFADMEREGYFRCPIVPSECTHNGHIYYLIMRSAGARANLISSLKEQGIMAVFHYVPLHSSPAGRKFGRAAEALPVTDDLSARLVRLPLWVGMEGQIDRVIDVIRSSCDIGKRC
jgi:dTDP-4-amino-4,6-dideoxygalactose transaminase